MFGSAGSNSPRRVDPAIVGTVGLLVAITAASVFAEHIAGDPLLQNTRNALQPVFSPGHLFGTDHLGRDVLSRLLFGGRSSLFVSIGAAVLAGLIGTASGITAALDGDGLVDRGFQVVNDAVLAFPTILLAITVAMIFEPGRYQVMVTLAVVFSPVLFRVSRVQARRVIQQEFYQVSSLLGTNRGTRIVLHVLPNVIPQVVVQCASLAAIAIGTEAALSFLGLGTQPPIPSWGLMLNDGRRYLTQAPFLSLIPGLAAGLLAFCFQFLSDRLAESLQSSG